MCIICIEYQKNKMTVREARRALNEMRDTPAIDKAHALEVEDMLDEDDREDLTAWLNGWDNWLSQGSD